jgi:hypothetical protein
MTTGARPPQLPIVPGMPGQGYDDFLLWFFTLKTGFENRRRFPGQKKLKSRLRSPSTDIEKEEIRGTMTGVRVEPDRLCSPQS